MGNNFLDRFMAKFEFEGLTFDDISMVTQYADFLPGDTDISTSFSKNIRLNIPFVSAAMDTVTESPMAIAMAIGLSVTVSIAALTKGMFSRIFLENEVEISVSPGRKSAYWVTIEMSSKVSPSNSNFAMNRSKKLLPIKDSPLGYGPLGSGKCFFSFAIEI